MTWWDDLAGAYEEQRAGATREFITLMLELWHELQQQGDVTRVATELEKRARLGVFYTFDLAGRAQLRELAGGLKDGDLLTKAAETLALRQGALARERALAVLGQASLAQVSPYARLAAGVLVTDALRTGLQGGATLGGATHKRFTRVRPVKEPRSHSVLEGVVKRMDEPFVIGGIPVHGPGAAELPWSEKAWCGHALEYLRLNTLVDAAKNVPKRKPLQERVRQLPPPTRLDFLQSGNAYSFAEKLIIELHRLHPSPFGLPELFVARNVLEARAVAFELGVKPTQALGSSAYYAPGSHSIVVQQQIVEAVESRDVQQQISALRYVAHEWWHAMRLSKATVYGLEEGGAEHFANQRTYELTGVSGESIGIQPYDNIREALARLAGAAVGDDLTKREAWLLLSRQQANLPDWFDAQLRALGIAPQERQWVMSYSEESKGTWLERVNLALQRRQ